MPLSITNYLYFINKILVFRKLFINILLIIFICQAFLFFSKQNEFYFNSK